MRLGRFVVSDYFINDNSPRELFAVGVLFQHLIVLEARHNESREQYEYLALSLDETFDDVNVSSSNIKATHVPEYTSTFTAREVGGVKTLEVKFHRIPQHEHEDLH